MDNKKRFSKIKCTNCGVCGHTQRMCHSPVISYGVIALSVLSDHLSDTTKLIECLLSTDTIEHDVSITCDSMHILENFAKYKDIVKALLIMRKHSLGYTEFVRGRYAISNTTHIAFLFKQMTPVEIAKIRDCEFDHLWNDVWATKTHINKTDEYMMSLEKYTQLKDSATIRLCDFIKNTIPDNLCPEWGLPKGRRERNESDVICAMREFEEETGYTKNDYILFHNIAPIIENLIGTNGVKYRHVYYIALLTTPKQPQKNDTIYTQRQEIGDIGLFNLDSSLQKIRSYHTERRRILFSIFMNVMNILIQNNTTYMTNSP